MKCKNCGAPLVNGQIICSNCDTDNSTILTQTNDNMNNYQFNNEQIKNSNQGQNYGYNQTNENINYEEKKVSNKKQNIFLKIASILALFLGIALTIINILNLI